MKIQLAFISVFFILNSFSQTVSYKELMKKQIAAFNSANNLQEFKKVGDSFSAIASNEKKEWLPFYYAGISYALLAFEKPKIEIDAVCDKAELFAKKADSLSPNNSEVMVLKSMICAARILVNEKSRAQKYGAQSNKFANEAIKLNADNPRAYLLKAQNLLNTPEAFGGGIKKAKPVFEVALEKEKTFKPETSLHPNWGKSEIEKELSKLNATPTKK